MPSVLLITDEAHTHRMVALGLYLVTCGWLYHRRRAATRDLTILTAAAASVVVVVTCAVGELFEDADEVLLFLLLSVAIGGQVAGLARWLRTLHREAQQAASTQEGS